MNGRAIFKQHDAQNPITHFGDARPASYSAVRLDRLFDWMRDCKFDPFVSDDGAVRALSGGEKVLCEFHCGHAVAKRAVATSARLAAMGNEIGTKNFAGYK